MKRIIVLLIIWNTGFHCVQGQTQVPSKAIFRIFEDNDFLNYRGHGTDRAYTDGTRLDLFFPKTKHIVPDKLMPSISSSTIDAFGIGLMQEVYTPNNLSCSEFQPDDYPYAGALFAIFSNFSSAPDHHISIQEEIILGVMGPVALGAESQTMVHKMIHFTKPMGWGNQLKNDLLFNFNLEVEKQIAAAGRFFELIAGSKLEAGTKMNALSVYPLIRIGKMTPYFNGFLSRISSANSSSGRKKNWQLYAIFKPSIQAVLSNAMLEGGIFNRKFYAGSGNKMSGEDFARINHLVCSLEFGAYLVINQFSISFVQHISTIQIKHTYVHEYGNISLSFVL